MKRFWQLVVAVVLVICLALFFFAPRAKPQVLPIPEHGSGALVGDGHCERAHGPIYLRSVGKPLPGTLTARGHTRGHTRERALVVRSLGDRSGISKISGARGGDQYELEAPGFRPESVVLPPWGESVQVDLYAYASIEVHISGLGERKTSFELDLEGEGISRNQRLSETETCLFSDLSAGTYRLSCRGGGGADPDPVEFIIDWGEAVDHTLSPAATAYVLEGVVVDHAEHPIQDAIIHVQYRAFVGANPADMVRITTTDEQGRFRLRVREGAELEVGCEKDGFCLPRSLMVSFGDAVTRTVTIRLLPGSAVIGRVVDEQDVGIEGAALRLVVSPGSRPTVHLAESSPDGSFRFDSLSTGAPGSLFVSRKGFGVVQMRLPRLKVDETVLRITLPRERKLLVRVTDAKSGQLLDRAWVSAILVPEGKPDVSVNVPAVRADTGAWRVPGIPEGRRLEITAGAPGYESNSVSEAGEEELRISLSRSSGLILRGRVVDATGQPVAGAYVTADIVSGPGRGVCTDGAFAYSERDGAFTLRGLQPGNDYHIDAKKDAGFARGLGSQTKRFRVSSGMFIELVVRLRGEIRARFRAEDGSQIKRRWVFFAFRKINDPGSGEMEPGVFEILEDYAEKTIVRRIPPGEYEVTIRIGGFEPRVLPSVRVESGRIADLGLLELQRTGSCEVHLHTASDGPIARQLVALISSEWNVKFGITNDSGMARMSSPPGTYLLVLDASVYPMTFLGEVRIEKGKRVRIKRTVARGGGLIVQVVDKDGKAMPQHPLSILATNLPPLDRLLVSQLRQDISWVWLRKPPRRIWAEREFTTDEFGVLRVDGLAPGEYVVELPDTGIRKTAQVKSEHWERVVIGVP